MSLDVVDLLCDLVRIPSVNPMGRAVSGSEYYEHAVTNYLEGLFGKLNWPFERQEVEPNRCNIFARIEGVRRPEDGGALIVFEAHQDTVPVEGMTIPPWTPQVKDNRVYGRGACDIKGGMAAMIAALSRLAELRPADMPTMIMACSVNEELGSSGAIQMAKSWAAGQSKIVPRAPDAVIVAEPTKLNVVLAHKGVARWRCHTRGKAAHSSRPENGENAIYHMTRVVQAFEEYAKNIVGTLGHHPLVGSPTLSIGLIAGGISVNTVPDTCTIEIDRRLLPGENPNAAQQHVIDFIAQRIPKHCRIEHDPLFIGTGGLPDTHNRDLGNRLSEVIRRLHAPGEQIGVPFGTDAPAFVAIGSPVVVFGPGSIDQAHTCDEWVAIDQLRSAVEMLVEFGKTCPHQSGR